MSDNIEDLQDTYPGAGTYMLGDTPEESAALIALVRKGKKRANCAPLRDFKDDPDAMPVKDRIDIIADHTGQPTFVVKTVRIQEVRFCDLTENMAMADGFENLLAWRKATRARIKRSGNFDPVLPLLFEFFSLVEDLDGRQIEPKS